MTRIAHLTSVHVPDDIRIFHKECKTLALGGYDVVFVVPRDEPREEVVDGVRYHGLTRPRTRRDRMTKTLWQVYRSALEEHADIYHFHDPELMVVGFLLKMHGKKVVYDVHEDMPRQIMTRHWIPSRFRRPVSRGVEILERAGSIAWDGIITVTPTIARRFPEHKRAVVQNFPVPEELVTANPIPYEQRDPVVAYVGKLEGPRGAREMVRAMGELPEDCPARLMIAGTFEPQALEPELQSMKGWSRVDSRGWLKRAQIAELLGKARLGLVLLHPVENYLEAQPNKLFEYMAAGLPVVASDFPSWRALIDDAKCGVLVDPLDPTAIAGAIAWLLDNPAEAQAMGQRGQRAVQEKFTWKVEGDRLIDFYRSILTHRA